MITRQRWTASQEARLVNLIESGMTKSHCFLEIAEETGRTTQAVANHYYYSMQSQAIPEEQEAIPSTYRRWTAEEDAVLSRYVDANVDNLKACFMAVAEQIGRTPTAVASHWYEVLSKKETHFATISKTHIFKNRKNGKGVPSTSSIWRKFMLLVKRYIQ